MERHDAPHVTETGSQNGLASSQAAHQQYRGLQRLAWATLVAGFVLFVLLVVAIPRTVTWAIERVRQDAPAPVLVISGQVYVLAAGSPNWVVRAGATQLNPGDSISTHESSRAFLTLPDDSTVLMYPDTELTLVASNFVRYRPETMQITLEQSRGKTRIGVAPVVSPEKRAFRVRTPAFAAALQEGSFAVEVNAATRERGSETEAEFRGSLVARLGNAEVTDGERVVALSKRERVTTKDGRLPAAPLPAAQDLIEMGDFTALAPDWNDIWRKEDRSERQPKGTVTPHPDGVFLTRAGEGPGETVLVQHINRDVWDFEELILAVRVKAVYQNLPGGGTAGSEYPIMVRVSFRDITGGETLWYHGFYYDAPTDERYSTKHATHAPQDAWYEYEIDLLQLTPRPTFIHTIEVAAAGWSFEGAIQKISLVGE